MTEQEARILASELVGNRAWQVEMLYRIDDTDDGCRVMIQLREWPQLRKVLADVSDSLPDELADARECLLMLANKWHVLPDNTASVITMCNEGEDSPPPGWRP